MCVWGGARTFPPSSLKLHPSPATPGWPVTRSRWRSLAYVSWGLWGFALVGASCPWLFQQPLNGLLASGSSLSSDCAIRQPDGAGLRRNLIKPLRMPSWSPTPSQLLEVVHEAQVLTTLCPASQPGKDRDLTG